MSEAKTYLSDLAKQEGRIEQAYQLHRGSVNYADRPNFEAGYDAALKSLEQRHEAFKYMLEAIMFARGSVNDNEHFSDVADALDAAIARAEDAS